MTYVSQIYADGLYIRRDSCGLEHAGLCAENGPVIEEARRSPGGNRANESPAQSHQTRGAARVAMADVFGRATTAHRVKREFARTVIASCTFSIVFPFPAHAWNWWMWIN